MTREEITSKASQLRDAGASPEQIRRFIDAAFAEMEPAALQPTREAAPMTEGLKARMQYPELQGMETLPVSTPAIAGMQTELLATPLEMAGAIGGMQRYGVRGGVTGGFGANIPAQMIRIASGQQEGVSPKQAISSAIWGGLQIPGARTPESTLQALAEIGRVSAGMGAAGAGIETAGSLVEKGQLPSGGEVALAAAIPAIMGGTGQAIQQYGGAITRTAKEAGGNLLKYLEAGIETMTPGTMMPSKWGGYEFRRIRDYPAGSTAEAAQKTFNEFQEGLAKISGGAPQEPATVFEGLKRRVESGRLEDDLTKLGKTAMDAQEAVTAAQRAVQKAGATMDTRVLAEGRRVANEALDTAKEAALEKARQIAIGNVAGDVKTLNPAETYQAFRTDVLEPLQAAHKKHFDNLYGFFPSTEPVFDSSRVRKSIMDVSEDTFEKLPARVREILSSDRISLNALNQIKAELRERGNYGNFSPSAQEAGYRRASRAVTLDSEAQADKAFGPQIGEQYRAVSRDYRRFSEVMDEPGMAPFLSKDFREAPVKQLVDSLQESGVQSTKFKEVVQAINNLAAPQKTKVMYDVGFDPTMTQGGIRTPLIMEATSVVDKQLAEALKGHLYTMIRGNIINEATDRLGNVDPNKIVDILGKIGRNKNSLETLGLGSLDQVKELASLVKQYPSADKMTATDWNTLWSSPSFKKSWENGETMASLIRLPLQQSEIKDLTLRAVYAEQMGKKSLAQEKLDKAMKAAGDNEAMRARVQAQYEAFKNDPMFSVFNRKRGEALSTESYNALKSTLFDPTSSKPIHNEYVREIFSGLRKSPDRMDREMAQTLQTEYLTTYLSQPQRVGPNERMTTDRLASLAKPTTTSARNELERARAILDPDQFDRLRKVADAAEVLNRYEAYGAAGVPRDEVKNVAGMVRKGYYAIADLLRDREYDKAIEAILKPGYADRLAIKGEWIERAGGTVKAAAGPVTEQVLRYREEMQRPEGQRGPASLGRFMSDQMRQGVPPSVMQFAPAR